MQQQITHPGKLLDDKGRLTKAGYAKSLLLQYNRADIKASPLRIKEWDYYLVMNQNYAVAFTIADNSYMGLMSVSLLDFEKGWEHTETIMTPFPMGKTHMPSTSDWGDVEYKDKRLHLKYYKNKGSRTIKCVMRDFYQGKDLTACIVLSQPPMETMVIATPWKEDPKAFYYNQKINCMRAKGKVVFDGREYWFHPQTDFGTLDWGRGVWTYKNTWYWGSGNCDLDGHSFGFNIGYGFGDTTAASENMLFYDGKAHKLDRITFEIPEKNGKKDYMAPWKFTSTDGRFEMDFRPVLDRQAKTDVKLISTDQHQVFGKMTGTAVLDDGTKIQVRDMMCFAEDVTNIY